MSSSRRRRLGRVQPCSVTTALDGVARWHRHLPRAIGGLVAWEAYTASGWPCGVLLVGRPVARAFQERGVLEVTRCALDPDRRVYGAASALYRAAAEWAQQRGSPLVTYTLEGESGASLEAAGWVPDGYTRGGQWGCPSRPRRERSGVLAGPKRRWWAPTSA